MTAIDPLAEALSNGASPASPPRTEAEGEVGLITVTMGGKPYRVPALSIDKSEDWQASLAAELSELEVGLDSDGEDVIRDLLGQGSRARLKALAAYDVTGVLGGLANMRSLMSQREVAAATDAVLDAEFPFDEEDKRSVEAAFGLPLKVLALASHEMAVELSQRAKSLSGASPIGDSPTPTSGPAGPASNSSSAGRTGRGASAKKPKRRP